ncbi:MAG: hypothetical protein JNL82_22025 [Myxococcales bacterium]|nr:hypothetical protein [Myxococcales bacterium]
MHFGRRLLAPAFVLLACTPKPADTDGGSAGSSSGTSEGAEVTSATNPTTGGGATGDAATSDTPETLPGTVSVTLPTSAEGGSSSEPLATTTSPDTSGETGGQPGLPGACASVCMHWDTCEPGSAGPLDACVTDCESGIDIPSPCAMATAAFWQCVAELPCEEALKFLGGPDDPAPGSCLAELQDLDATCEQPECGGEVTGGDDFCELEQSCDGGVVQNFHCDIAADTCTCNEDGVPGKQCPAAGFCGLDHHDQVAAAEACCGWEWMF